MKFRNKKKMSKSGRNKEKRNLDVKIFVSVIHSVSTRKLTFNIDVLVDIFY